LPFVLAFFGLTFIVTFAAFLLFILTVLLDTRHKESEERMEIGKQLYELQQAKGADPGRHRKAGCLGLHSHLRSGSSC
jgi:uncharacterized membrane protein